MVGPQFTSMFPVFVKSIATYPADQRPACTKNNRSPFPGT